MAERAGHKEGRFTYGCEAIFATAQRRWTREQRGGSEERSEQTSWSRTSGVEACWRLEAEPGKKSGQNTPPKVDCARTRRRWQGRAVGGRGGKSVEERSGRRLGVTSVDGDGG